jgi:hypothetical protein
MYKFIRRDFLNAAPELAHTSYVLCHVEDSDSGREAHGSNVLTIGDCKRVISLDFYLGDKEARDSSIAKINLLLEVLSGFRSALLNEAYAIAKVEGERSLRIQQIAATLEDAEKASESEAQPEVEKLRDVLKRGPLWQIKDCLDTYESITKELREVLENVIGSSINTWPTEQE